MELIDYFKGIIDASKSPIVVCNLDYRIIYMNKAAIESYQTKYRNEMTGTSMRRYFNEDMSIEWFKEGLDNNQVFAFHDDNGNQDVYIRAIRNADKELIGFFDYHEYRDPEQGKEYDLD